MQEENPVSFRHDLITLHMATVRKTIIAYKGAVPRALHPFNQDDQVVGPLRERPLREQH